MKFRTLFLIALLYGAAVFAQPAKVPVKTPVPGPVSKMKPLSISKLALGPQKYKYSSDNGHVDISYARSKSPGDHTIPTSSESKAAMCLTREEVKGQKIENELIIADGSKALQILPGGVIDADILLRSGEFKYIMMDKRKAVTLSTTSNQADRVAQTVRPQGNKSIESILRAKVHEITRPSNIEGMPNLKSSSEVQVSTLDEKTGLNVGASFFYMGISVDNNFRFSSEKYRYMYLYQFEQECLAVAADAISGPEQVFTETVKSNDNWLYVREVKYGRRLYVFMESEVDLSKYANELDGKLNWEVVKAKLELDVKTSTLSQFTNIKIITQGGQPVAISDKSKLQETLDRYARTPFKQMDLVPLSYKLTYLDGTPVSMITNAFLDGKNCLSSSKVKIRVSKIEVKKSDDGNNRNMQHELYGSATINYYDASGKKVALDGRSALPPTIGTGSIGYGTKDAAITVGTEIPKTFPEDQQGKYTEFLLPNLDMKIEIKPFLKEKDNGLNKDDDYMTEDIFKFTLRDILIKGLTSPFFEFRRKEAVLKIYFEILPY